MSEAVVQFLAAVLAVSAAVFVGGLISCALFWAYWRLKVPPEVWWRLKVPFGIYICMLSALAVFLITLLVLGLWL